MEEVAKVIREAGAVGLQVFDVGGEERGGEIEAVELVCGVSMMILFGMSIID